MQKNTSQLHTSLQTNPSFSSQHQGSDRHRTEIGKGVPRESEGPKLPPSGMTSSHHLQMQSHSRNSGRTQTSMEYQHQQHLDELNRTHSQAPAQPITQGPTQHGNAYGSYDLHQGEHSQSVVPSMKWPRIPLLSHIFSGIRPQPSNFAPKRPKVTHPNDSRRPLPSQSVYSSSRPSQPAPTTSRPTPASSTMGINNMQYLITGGCLLLALGLMTDVQAWLPQSEASDVCQEVVRHDAILSREHLAKILAVSERTAKTAIQQVVAEPYCRLPAVSIRAGVVANREAYPLAFDPDTWLVMLYEGEEYAGFDFSFRK